MTQTGSTPSSAQPGNILLHSCLWRGPDFSWRGGGWRGARGGGGVGRGGSLTSSWLQTCQLSAMIILKSLTSGVFETPTMTPDDTQWNESHTLPYSGAELRMAGVSPRVTKGKHRISHMFWDEPGNLNPCSWMAPVGLLLLLFLCVCVFKVRGEGCTLCVLHT